MFQNKITKGIHISISIIVGILLLATLLGILDKSSSVHADPIDPPEGYPKLSLSVKTVTPTLANIGSVVLNYVIEIRNTGAYTAENTTLTDVIPSQTTYNGDATSNTPSMPTFNGTTLSWLGDVGFDMTAIISFSVTVEPSFEGNIENTAVISQSMISEPVSITAKTTITDEPILVIEKEAMPAIPGANKAMTYTITVVNWGQPTVDMPITVMDVVPTNTTLRSIGTDGFANVTNDLVTWTRNVTLPIGQSTHFTFSVTVDDVVSGTVISNDDYSVSSTSTGLVAGEPYTTTIIDPILSLSKQTWPDPPGSNREMTYTLILQNKGSLATDLVITDVVPIGTTYVRGGSETDGVVSWTLPELDTNAFAEFTFTVYIGDIAGVAIVNDSYSACTAENVCQSGNVLTSVVQGPTFEVLAILDPIAKKPGGGGGPVTPTLVVWNVGPGNAIDAQATLQFTRISVNASDLYAIPAVGTPPPFPTGPVCGDQCNSYIWVGSINVGEVISFTTFAGQNTIGGAEGTIYSTTIIITDSLSNMTTTPVSDTARGKVTHFSNLIPTKSAPTVIGQGQVMTYTINVWNSALATDLPPVLTDTVPLSTTLVNISDGGISMTVGTRTIVSWTLPNMGPGDTEMRSFSVQIDSDLVSGTQIFNNDYATRWYETNASTFYSQTGQSVTTTVQEVGLIHSFKQVTPTLSLPGSNVVLTYTIHVVNSSGISLTDVTVYDLLPWEDSTYLRNAVASSGTIISDIVSIQWIGDVGAFSSEVITLSVLVDEGFKGVITNTAVISHSSLLDEVVIDEVAYITDQPLFHIHKWTDLNLVELGEALLYTIEVINLGQVATDLIVTDTIPINATYIVDSANVGGQLISDQIRWQIPILEPKEVRLLSFSVIVDRGPVVVNDTYGVTSIEGVTATGLPVITTVAGGGIYLPILRK